MGIKCPKCQFENPDTVHFCGECGTQLISKEEIPVTETLETPTEELTTGSTFAGRYQIIEELGKGGMGKVYKAQDTDLKEKVAIKLLKPEIAADKKTIERFRNELKFARKIRHKNVCQMYDLNKEKGAHYITMEYVDGKDLKSMIRMMGQLSSGKTIFIAKQVCEGLAEAHRLGVIHRDLKPQNVMVDEDGNARIMDFGIARSLKTKGITATGMMIGTPEYMSPEQVEGKEVDQRSDIYSLGVILYEMVTGRVPFEGDTPFTIGVKHKSETPKDPKELNTQIPEDLNFVILRCLEKDKEKRYQSAGEVRTELTRIEKGIPTAEIEIPKKKPLTSREITVTFGLKKLFIPAIIVVALIIAAVLIWQLLPRKAALPSPTGKASLAIMYFKNNTGVEGLDIWRTALSDLMIADLSQSKFINVLSGDKLFEILKELNLLDAISYTSRDLKQLASQGGATHILTGILTKSGDSYRINTTLQAADTMEIIGSEMVEGKGEESFHSMVDELTRRVKTSFKLSEEQIAGDIDREVEKITTSSTEAYKYYSEGRKYHLNTDYVRSIQLMERAIELDPEFAMAYRSMGVSYDSRGFVAEGRKHLKKAVELSNRLSERERYIILGSFFMSSDSTYDKAIDAYQKLLELYPDDRLGNQNLGSVYASIEEWDKAIEKYQVAFQSKNADLFSYSDLASAYMGKGLYDKAREVLSSYLDNFPDNALIHRNLSLTYIHEGELDLALEEIDKAFLLDPSHFVNIRRKGDIYLYKGDFIQAEKEYQKLIQNELKEARAWGIVRLGYLYLAQGKFRKAREVVNVGIELAQKAGEPWAVSGYHQMLAHNYQSSGNYEQSLKEAEEALKSAVAADFRAYQIDALYLKGIAYVKMKSLAEAEKTAEELKQIVEEGLNSKRMRTYYYLTGLMKLEKEKFSEAIQDFKKYLSLQSYGPLCRNARVINSLALAHYRSGDVEKAREEYERITSLTEGKDLGDIYSRSFCKLGKIYEEQGDKSKAIENYEKFLDL
jgi:tetratricopeptide (TPR) repeat protein/tRNA A-37 threonylcarbamoyl transferase component Bud32